MKTKQVKEDPEKSIDEDLAVEPKTRARKKASDVNDDDKTKTSLDEPKTSKEPKKSVGKPKAIVKKRPLGIRKTLRNKKTVTIKDIKSVIKAKGKRGRKPALKPEPDSSLEKETVPLIPASEIKTEPIDETPNSRSSSPKTAGRRQRLTSDMAMMKSVLGDSPSSLVLGPRTSPYSMRSERSNSPSMFEGKNLRSGKPRKVKTNLLNEVVMKEQKKRRRLLSESKAEGEVTTDCEKVKRIRSCSKDGSEISKCSDATESDISLNDTLNDTDSKELNKKIDKPKTDLDVDIENNVQISTIEKVPSLNDSKVDELNADTSLNDKNKKKQSLSLKRSTSLDSDNNNSNRLKLENLHSSDIEDKLLMKTENDTLFEARSSILTSMSKTFNSKEVSKNIRKARRGRKAGGAGRGSTGPAAKPSETTIANDVDDKGETLETLSKEINDLINNLDENIDRDHEMTNETNVPENSSEQMQAKQVSKFYGLSKPLGDNNSIALPDTPVKDKDSVSPASNETTPSKIDDSENIRLHYDEDSQEKMDAGKQEISFKVTPVASIDKLMDRLKEFEEFDKRRQRQESETKPSESKPMMVTSDVVLIPKSGIEFKTLKEIQAIKSPDRSMGNVLSCFENNSAISIVKRDHVRKSVDIDLTNSVTLIKRNSISARKESTGSDHSKESDAISIFEKSLGKDVTLTEIRKSVEKPAPPVDLNQLATLQPTTNSSLSGVLDSNQISITPRTISEVHVTKRKSRDSSSRKSSETNNETEEKLAIIEKIKTLVHLANKTPTPVAAKSLEVAPVETEALPPPVETAKPIPDLISQTTDLPKVDSVSTDLEKAVVPVEVKLPEKTEVIEKKVTTKTEAKKDVAKKVEVVNKEVPKPIEEVKAKTEEIADDKESGVEKMEKKDSPNNSVLSESADVAKTGKSPGKGNKSARNSIESVAGPSNILHETPESQKHKENVLRTLGLLTHKAAKEAKIEKLKEKERIYSGMASKGKGKSGSGEYTGTLKTVIKLNRSIGDRDKKKYRSSLKMTFQKSKVRSGKPEVSEAAAHDEYYTIERREAAATSEGGHRKTHYSNRLNHDSEAVVEPVEPPETLNLVIPEKASSFSIHPGRLCQDQCFYCGGKFGLFDTPCHIAQMKSADRQKKVLDNEEKLTIDSCLCDACYRHVDRRANCPSYRQRPLNKPPSLDHKQPPNAAYESSKAPSPPMEEESSSESVPAGPGPAAGPPAAPGRPAACHTAGCSARAEHSIRRKWLIKMRTSVNKVLQLQEDYPGLHTIPLCGAHHSLLAPLLACALCRRRLTKHHNLHTLHHGIPELNSTLKGCKVPVQLSERPVLCKMCRYYCTLLQRPSQTDPHAAQYTRKLLQIYKIDVPPASETEVDESGMLEEANNSLNRQKKKARSKSKGRKSSDPDRSEDSNERNSESPKSKDKSDESSEAHRQEPMEEDIESLISSNKIPVPGAKSNDPTKSRNSDVTMDNCDPEGIYDFDGPLMVFDKQTELQILLQKQNNPAQFMPKPNLTQKQRNYMKVHQASGVQKPGQVQKIHDKNAKKIHKLGQIITHKDKLASDGESETEKSKEGLIFKNLTVTEECSIESIPNKKPADITTLKSKWQMSESFTQVKRNLSELSKKVPSDKEKKSCDVKYSNPVKRLETNPSISVRELFPGEEEMSLQCSVEFNNVKGVTPEGWEKCNTTIQYDTETKKLWNELQRPYGNQSSFLRHLILLEKYFRSGDLILSQNASSNATCYSDSVQNRVRAYDNIPDPPKRTETSKSLIEFRKKPAVNGKSLLKTNHSEGEKEPKKTMPPPVPIFPKPKPPKSDKAKSKALPPELIAINTPNAQGRKAIQNVLHNIQQLVKGVSASDPTEIAAAPLPPATLTPAPEPPTPTPAPLLAPKEEKKETSKSETPSKKQKTTSKPWRPTLMPITPENLSRIATEPRTRAVDGRSLPSLVQVMSGGGRYHITLADYNKMCVMRREKLQQLQDSEPALDQPDYSQIGSNAANILKNVGLKNITIAPIPPKTATVTSLSLPPPAVSSPALLVTSTPIKLPALGSCVSLTSETVLTPSTALVPMPRIPKSLTVIPQTVITPQSVTVSAATVTPTQAVLHTADGRP